MAEIDPGFIENRNRTIKTLLIIGAVVLAALIIFNLFRYSFTTISVSDTANISPDQTYNVVLKDRDSGEIAYTYVLEGGDTKVSGILKRKDYVVEARAQNAETRKSISSGFIVTNVEVSLEPQIKSQKISYTNESCVNQSSIGIAVSYSCLRNTALFQTRYFNSGVQKSVINDLTENRYQNYQQGVMALEENYGNQLFADFRGLGYEEDKQMDLTDIIDGYQNGDPVRLITDSSNNRSSQFEIQVYDSSTLYIFSGLDDTNPKTINLDNVASSDAVGTNFVLTQSGEEVSGYFGLTSISPESEEASEVYNNYGGGTLIFFDLNGGDNKFVKTPKELLISNLSIVGDYLLAQSSNGIEVYDLGERSSLKLVSSIPGTQSPLPYGENSFVFLADNNVYRYDLADHSYKLLYAGNRFIISALNVVGEKIYLSAFLNNDSTQNLHGFVLVNEPVELPRIEERLPYVAGTASVSYMDYVDNNVFVYLALDTFIYGTGEYDQADFEAKKADFLRRFEADGFNPADFNMYFYPS